ncbi:MAG: HDOD domain-containing protein [Desulfovibrio sp.]|nr:HDOD domain-containing protein [Desulfovibrio sp.]
MMEKLDLRNVRPGRKLGQPVFGADGILLFPPGRVLTQEDLNSLAGNGVTTISLFPAARTESVRPAPAAVLFPTGVGSGSDARPPFFYTLSENASNFGVPVIDEGNVEKISDYTAERFRLLDAGDPLVMQLFNIAVERQIKVYHDKPSRIPAWPEHSDLTPGAERPRDVSMQKIMATSHRMGTLPTIFHRLVGMINNPIVNSEELSKVIAVDPALTAKLLKLVNSPFFGLPYKIDSISRAVLIVGTKQLVMLSMGATLIAAFKGLPVSLVNMQSYWSHSISCGAACRLLCAGAGVQNAEGFFVSGLLHDIARLLIYTQLPDHARYIVTEAARRNVTVHDMELETLGYAHEDLGAELLRSWNCPTELVQRVLMHHQILPPDCPAGDVILPTANMLSQALGYGSSGEVIIPPQPEGAWAKVGLDSEGLLRLCAELDNDVRELRTVFAPA